MDAEARSNLYKGNAVAMLITSPFAFLRSGWSAGLRNFLERDVRALRHTQGGFRLYSYTLRTPISQALMGSPPSLQSEAPQHARIRERCASPGHDRAPRRSLQ